MGFVEVTGPAVLALLTVALISVFTAQGLTLCLKRRDAAAERMTQAGRSTGFGSTQAVARGTLVEDPDFTFWVVFSGGFAVVATLAAAAVSVPGSGPLVAAAAVLCCGLALGWVWHGEHERARRRRAQRFRREAHALLRRHEHLLQAWAVYELDPARAIDFPAMADVANPETAALIRAMRRAALLRAELERDDVMPDAYAPAVAGLEAAFEQAELAAGARQGESLRPGG
jgi:hypothetical protein